MQKHENSVNPNADRESLLGAYKELCASYHSVDDFRMKLLGLLPLTSLVGIFGLRNDALFAQTNEMSRHLIVFIGIFAAAFTLALFIYEIRGIFRCSNLIERGRDIERALKIEGQFLVCVEENDCKKNKESRKHRISFVDAKLAACVIYSTVFSAWLFTVLKFGFGFWIYGCAFTALAFGIVLGLSAFVLIKRLIAP